MPDFPYLEIIERHGRISQWSAPDGAALRRFDMPAGEGGRRGSLLFQGGRGDIFEKYFEAFVGWRAAGWAITAFDWRGQGGSGRLGADPRIGHLVGFAPLIADLRGFWADWAATAPGPHVAIGHSMGGYLLLRGLVEGSIDPAAAVLVAPMLGVNASPFGAPLAERVAAGMLRIGRPDRAAWRDNERPHTLATRQALLTHDPRRYGEEIAWKAERPELALGPPSWSWVLAALRETRQLRDDSRIDRLTVPLLILSADADKLVDPAATAAVAARLPAAELIRFGPESAHEILREADPVRDRALAAIDAFLDRAAPAP